MKRALRAWMARAGRHDLVWQIFKSLKMLSAVLAEPWHQADMARRQARQAAMAVALSPKLAVLHGPFTGLRYATAESAGSALLPKLLGSYERELHSSIEELLQNNYSDVVDVGCAEGYYAVGLAVRMPQARVHAFDTEARARELCLQMARLNGVESRLQLGAWCDPAALLRLELGPRALVISDCEGYEALLFTPEVAQALAAHDVLIEVHDRADPELGDRLQKLFLATHHVELVDSIDDTRKLRSYCFDELKVFDPVTRREVLSEGRGMVMQWLLLRSRAAVPAAATAIVVKASAQPSASSRPLTVAAA